MNDNTINDILTYKAQLKILTANYTWHILIITAILLIGILFVAFGLYKWGQYIQYFKAQKIDGNNISAKNKKFGSPFYSMLAIVIVGLVLTIFAITQYANDYLNELSNTITNLKTTIKLLESKV